MRVFLTGGTGSLGQALLKHCTPKGWLFTVYSRDEAKQSELRAQYPQHRFVLGDVRSLTSLQIAMRGHEAVVHAAAYKQVPSSEVNAAEAVEVNVLGSLNVARAAVMLDVPQVVGISTDKACAPINCYGQTKALMEKLFQQACLWGTTKFTLVRYGNVLGSRGSVEPLFRKQAAAGGPITITEPTMTRFWLTMNQAIELVLEALMPDLAAGIVIVPKASASTMSVLAEAVAPGIPVKVTGIRAGEKLHEQLVHLNESLHAYAKEDRCYILPAHTSCNKALGSVFEYRSDNAHQLSVLELRRMLEA